ncbi:MAG: DnaJ domain-containing protein, partial [Anaerolineae bacterium]|nr:DnaJ domain-containing protein [Anaerolineae bacterium]
LRDYYLDLSQLEGMDAQRVADLIAQFWTRHQAQDARADALATLGLRDPVDAPTIKQTYRRLAMRHHPDRGGDAAQLQAIHQAMQTLALTR